MYACVSVCTYTHIYTQRHTDIYLGMHTCIQTLTDVHTDALLWPYLDHSPQPGVSLEDVLHTLGLQVLILQAHHAVQAGQVALDKGDQIRARTIARGTFLLGC